MTTRITLPGGSLHRAVDWVSRLCPTKPTAPVLQGVLIKAGERLTLSASDWDTTGTVGTDATITEPGRALVSGRLLAAIAKTCDHAPQVTITCAPGGVTLDAGRGNRWQLPMLPVEEYPQLPDPGKPIATVEGATLRRCLTRTLPAADRTGSIRFASSAALVGDAAGMTLAATDGHRLATTTLPWEPVGEGALDVLVPLDLLDAAVRMVGAEGAAVELATDGQVLTFATADHRLTGRLTAADWPNWRRLLTAEHVARVTFVVAELLAAVDRVLAVCDEKTPICLAVSSDGFTLSAFGEDRSGHAVAPVSDYEDEGDARVVALNPTYLRDALRVLGTDLGMLRFGPHMASPLDVLPVNTKGEPEPDYRHLIVPIHPDRLRQAA